MQVVMLIGGLGTRLYPFTYTTPKSLLPIANRRFLELECEWLHANGATDVVLAVSHFASAIIEFLQQTKVARGFNVKIRMEDRPLGSGGALKNCADILQDDFLLLNGDILMDMDLGGLLEFHRNAGAMVTATVSKVEDTRRWGILDIQDDDRVLGWQEKPESADAKSLWGNVGAWAISRKILDIIPEDRFVSLEKETFPLLFEKKQPFFGHRFSGYWKDIGTLENYVQANRDLLAGALKGVKPKGRESTPGVWIDETAQVDDQVDLVAPVVIGGDCRIGHGSRITGPSVIGQGVKVGIEAKIKSSIVWANAQIGDHAQIDDAVVGEARIGSNGALGTGCAVASNSLIEEGVKLPAGTVLGPASRLFAPSAGFAG